jgi:hypothetical protein
MASMQLNGRMAKPEEVAADQAKVEINFVIRL